MTSTDAEFYNEVKNLQLPLDKGNQVIPVLAAGLNILPGFGNFYLAVASDNQPSQWAFGCINFLLWAPSVLWAIPEAAIDANTINKISVVTYYRTDPAGQNLLEEARDRNPDIRKPGRKTPKESVVPPPKEITKEPPKPRPSIKPLPPEQRARLAVLDFEDKTPAGGTNYGQHIAESFTTSCIRVQHFQVVEREQIKKLIAEQKFSTTDLVDQTKAVELGKILNVQYILLGSVSKLGTAYSIQARIISVETGVGIAAASRQTDREENLDKTVIELTEDMVSQL